MKSFEDKWQDKEGTTFFLRGWEPEAGKPKALVALAKVGNLTALRMCMQRLVPPAQNRDGEAGKQESHCAHGLLQVMARLLFCS